MIIIPRRSGGAISATYNGAATAVIPIPIPTSSRDIVSVSALSDAALANAPTTKIAPANIFAERPPNLRVYQPAPSAPRKLPTNTALVTTS